MKVCYLPPNMHEELKLKEKLLKKWKHNLFPDVSILSAHLGCVLILSGTYTNGNVCMYQCAFG